MPGDAMILAGPTAESASRAQHRRHGLQYDVVPLLKLPGGKDVDSAVPLREKLRRATTRSV